MISALGPFGPGFKCFPLENRNLYFCRTSNSLNRRNVEGLKATAVCRRRLVDKNIKRNASQIRCKGETEGPRCRPRLRTMSCCLSRRFCATTAFKPSFLQRRATHRRNWASSWSNRFMAWMLRRSDWRDNFGQVRIRDPQVAEHLEVATATAISAVHVEVAGAQNRLPIA